MWQFFVSRIRSINLRNWNWNKLKKYLPISILVVTVLGVIGGTIALVRAKSKFTDARVQVPGAKASQEVNKEFPIAIKDANGKEATKIKMVLQTAELRDEILVQGQRATSIKGRSFLILSLKLSNDFDKGVQMNVKDYFRLTVNGKSSEQLAADIHNDPVVIQAKSTKYSRIGFPVNDTDKQLTLWVGEITGDKQKIDLNLK